MAVSELLYCGGSVTRMVTAEMSHLLLATCYLLLATCYLLPEPSLDTGRVWVMVRGSARERASPASWDSEWRTVKLGEVEVEVKEVEVEDCLRSTSSS